MRLKDLGYTDALEGARIEKGLGGFGIGRVISEHKERYAVATESGEVSAEITGNLRYTARGREDFPAVGDWVAITAYDGDLSIIHAILPRRSTVARQAVGQFGDTQIIATNVDYALLIQAVDRDFNVNRLERYLAICHASNVGPIIVLTKTDLLTGQAIAETVDAVRRRIEGVPVIAISNETRDGLDDLRKRIVPGSTYCMLGSSGVGKSTLTNNLSGRAVMRTDAISESTNKGRHVTSHRELIVLEGGGILIDNPGMREVGVGDAAQGLDAAFARILGAAMNCRFRDCTHTCEEGCSVLEAVNSGAIERGAYENYLKTERERAHYEASVAERHKKDRDFGRMLKRYQKNMRDTQR